MLSLKTKTTNRKFYGKWLYKVNFRLPGCALFRSKNIDEIRTFCTGPDPEEKNHWSVWSKAYTNRESILDISDILVKYPKDSYNLRIETDFLDIYTNELELYDEISLKLANIIRYRSEPGSADIEILQQNNHYITVKKLPKGRYNYRVYLQPHKMRGDKEAKTKYLEWLKRQSPRVTCTPAIEKWFLTTDWNWDRRYVLVEDEPTLLMLKLRGADVVGRIYNFVISDK